MIDWTRVSDFREEVGAEDFDEVAELFLEEVAQAMANVRPDVLVTTLESELHSIKGSALNLGFQALAEQCRLGEKAAAGGLIPTDVLAILPKIYQDSLDAFAKGRANLGNAA